MGSEQSDAAVLAARFDNMIRTMHRLGERLEAAEARIYTLELFKHSVLESRTAGEQGKPAAIEAADAYSADPVKRADYIAGFYAGIMHASRQSVRPIMDRERRNEGLPPEPTPPPAASGIGYRIAEKFVSESSTLPLPEHGDDALNAQEQAIVDELAGYINSAVAEARPSVTRLEAAGAVDVIRMNHPIAGWKLSQREAEDQILALMEGKT